MKLYNLADMTEGWVIGDFEPSLLRTKEFEVAIKSHKRDEFWPEHYHPIATEYNILLNGKMLILCENIEYFIQEGDIFVVEPKLAIKPLFETDCTVVTIKVPSIPGDKVCTSSPTGVTPTEE